MNRKSSSENNDRAATSEEAKLAEKILLRQDAKALPSEIEHGQKEEAKWIKYFETDRFNEAIRDGLISVKFTEKPTGGERAVEVRFADGRLEYYSDPLAFERAIKNLSERKN